MMVEMIWKEPPPAVSSKYAPALGELKKNPGRWALVQESTSSSGAGQPWKKLGCEASVHRANPGEAKARYDVYARWPEPKTGTKPPTSYPAGARETQTNPVIQSRAGTYDPSQRDARGVPSNGLPVDSLHR